MLTESQKRIITFIYSNYRIFKPLNTYNKWKIGDLLEKNKLVSNGNNFIKSNFFKMLVLNNVFIAQSDTYKYDSEKLLDFGQKCMEEEEDNLKHNEVRKTFKKTFGIIPPIPPNWRH